MTLDATPAALALAPCTATVEASPVDAARAYAAASKADNTRRAYAGDVARWRAWADAQGIEAMPAPPAAVAVYLAQLARDGRSVSTVARALAGIAAASRAAGAWESRHPALTAVMAGIRRTHGTAARQAAPVEVPQLRALIGALDVSTLAGLRDRAVLLIGWFAALRRSEIAALDVADVSFVAEGVTVEVRRSKTDQTGAGARKGVPYAGDAALCPVRALRAYLDAARLDGGRLFRSIDRHGRLGDALSDRTVARIVQAAAAAAGLDASAFSGHSLRAGFATAAARQGRSLDAIMRQTGHRSERVARRYIRHATLFVDNAAAGLV